MRKYFFNRLLHVFFPSRCWHCTEELIAEEKFLCCYCDQELERVYYGPINVHLLEEIDCYGLYFYEEKSLVQKLIHGLKYGHIKQLGFELGFRLAATLPKSCLPQLILPVPITPRKCLERGYNQSEWISKGFQAYTGVRMNVKLLKRIKNTPSQTQLSKRERQKNVNGAFKLAQPLPPGINHVGIIDDVLTTGATLQQVVKVLNAAYPHLRITIFVASIARG